MSAIDVRDAKAALAARLHMWNVGGAEAKAAEFIDQLMARGWRMDASREERPQPPRTGEVCRICQRHADRCICRDEHGRPTGPTTTPPRPSECADDYLKTLRDQARRAKERA